MVQAGAAVDFSTQYTPATTVLTRQPIVQAATTINKFGADRDCPTEPIARAMAGPTMSTAMTPARRATCGT
jgi:hypothetical protein